MNIVLYSRAQPSFSAEDLDLLINALDETGMSYRMNKDFAGLIGAKTGRTFGAEQIYRDSAGIGDDARVMVSYGGDVNGSGVIDINDAQLVYDMYNAHYASFSDVAMYKFLCADIADDTPEGSTLLNVSDAVAVISKINQQ